MYRFDAPLCDAHAERARARVRGLVNPMLGYLQQELADRGYDRSCSEAVGSVRDPAVGDELRQDSSESDMLDSVEQALGSIGVGG